MVENDGGEPLDFLAIVENAVRDYGMADTLETGIVVLCSSGEGLVEKGLVEKVFGELG